MKLVITKRDGSVIEMNYEDVAMVAVANEGMTTTITTSTVSSTVDMLKLQKYVVPEMTMTVGDKDGDGYKWLTSASMYGTYNGRIMGRNLTLGYANTEKPLAVKPWVRGQK